MPSSSQRVANGQIASFHDSIAYGIASSSEVKQYPESAASGYTITFAWFAAASSSRSMTRARLPRTSPSVTSIWTTAALNVVSCVQAKVLLPDDLVGMEHRTLVAGAEVLESLRRARVLNLHHAAHADAETAGHQRFERDLARDSAVEADVRDSAHHDGGAAGVYVDRPRGGIEQLQQRFGHNSPIAVRAVVGRVL